ncbi:hypothetical protein BDI4_340046 [Burkholderia diffusa]|nr:hypothetical protein BDI4_340046 [Burkholderia diffusa]
MTDLWRINADEVLRMGILMARNGASISTQQLANDRAGYRVRGAARGKQFARDAAAPRVGTACLGFVGAGTGELHLPAGR